MKKVPILLSTMILTPMAATLVTPMVNAKSNEHLIAPGGSLFVKDPLSGETLAIAEQQADQLDLNENAWNPFFNFLSVDYKQNQMGIQINDRDDWSVKRVVIAYRNYEEGITEVEADAQLRDLGVKNEGTWRTLWDYDAKGVHGLYMYVVPRDKNGQIIKLSENLTDILYYAVEYGHKTDTNGETEWQDEWWFRGKISYRNCAHAEVFNPNTMICVQEGDGSYSIRKSDYSSIDEPSGKIMTWDEEWNEIQRQRYLAAEKSLIGLRDNLYNVLSILGNTDKVIAGLDKTLPKSENMDDGEFLLMGNEYLKELSKEIREYYASLSASVDQSEMDQLKEEREKLLQKIEQLKEENSTLSARNTELDESNSLLIGENKTLNEENERLRQENMELKGSSNGGDNQGSATEVKETKEQGQEVVKIQELVPIIETETVSNQGDTNITQNKSDETVNSAGALEVEGEDEVAVPSLGEIDDKNQSELGIWWVLLSILGLITGAGVVWKYVVKGRRK